MREYITPYNYCTPRNTIADYLRQKVASFDPAGFLDNLHKSVNFIENINQVFPIYAFNGNDFVRSVRLCFERCEIMSFI